MAIRKQRKKVHVSLSSMTDIIFMLLIFFMLTSSLVRYFGYQLPISDSRTTGNIRTTVNIQKNGQFSINEQPIPADQLESKLRSTIAAAPDRDAPLVTIAAEVGVPFEQVTRVMAITNRLGMKARTVLATEPRE
jgi:biopolymer transport protein ExbD